MSRTKPCVFIVEDDNTLRRGLARFFADRGFRVVQFEDGEHAVSSDDGLAPALVVCDYKLPGITGLEVLKIMRDAGLTSSFVLMTAYYTEELKKLALNLGASEVLEKPFDLSDLMEFCDAVK